MWALLGPHRAHLGGQLGSFRAFVDYLKAILGHARNTLPMMPSFGCYAVDLDCD